MFLWWVWYLKSTNSRLPLLFVDEDAEAHRCAKIWQSSKKQKQKRKTPKWKTITTTNKKPKTISFFDLFTTLDFFPISHLLWAHHWLMKTRVHAKARALLKIPGQNPRKSFCRQYSLLCWETIYKLCIIFLWILLLCKLYLCYY